jgi:hypothetical protein
VCDFSVVKDKETKHCYSTECKPICIPRVTFPWQKGCGHAKGKACGDECSFNGCARVKVVRVLMKEEYECSRCKCVWTPVSIYKKDAKDAGRGWEGEAPAEP